LSGFISQFYLKQAKTRKKSQRGALGRPATWQKKNTRPLRYHIYSPAQIRAGKKKRSPAQISAAKKLFKENGSPRNQTQDRHAEYQ
jgi:hypothetical protein